MTRTVFRIIPPKSILERILLNLQRPISSFPSQITKEELQSYPWGDELVELLPYYIPSMIPRFFDEESGLPFQNATILRHLLRIHGYNLVGKETMNQYMKTTTYTLSTDQATPSLEEEVVVSFT